MKIDGSKILFSSGREFYANNGIVGLSPELELFEGYDAHLEGYDQSLTPDESAELADFMIDLWRKFKDGRARS